MLEIRTVISPEKEKTIKALLTEYGIKINKEAETVLLEEGQPEPECGVLIRFNPDRLEPLAALFSTLCENRKPAGTFLIGSRHNTWQTIKTADILFFRADGNYVYAVTTAAEYEVKLRLYELEKRFKGGSFIRTGKSCIVNILKVQEIIPWFGSRLLLRIEGTEQRVEVSRNFIKSFKAYLEMSK